MWGEYGGGGKAKGLRAHLGSLHMLVAVDSGQVAGKSCAC